MENHVKAATVLANLLDNQFNFFGLRFGITAVLDFIPEVGDILAAVLSLYLIWIALKMRVPMTKIIVMVWNILFNFLIGLIPVVGDAVYIFRRANMRNLQIIKEYAGRQVINAEEVV